MAWSSADLLPPFPEWPRLHLALLPAFCELRGQWAAKNLFRRGSKESRASSGEVRHYGLSLALPLISKLLVRWQILWFCHMYCLRGFGGVFSAAAELGGGLWTQSLLSFYLEHCPVLIGQSHCVLSATTEESCNAYTVWVLEHKAVCVRVVCHIALPIFIECPSSIGYLFFVAFCFAAGESAFVPWDVYAHVSSMFVKALQYTSTYTNCCGSQCCFPLRADSTTERVSMALL